MNNRSVQSVSLSYAQTGCDRHDEALVHTYIGRRFKNDAKRREKQSDPYTEMMAKVQS